MGAALHGNLQDFGIAEVFQLIGQQRKTGVLEVENDKRVLRIQFDGGSVVVAEPVGASEHDALADMLVRCGWITRERADAIGRDSVASARSYRAVAVASDDVSVGDFDSVADLLTQEVIFEVLRYTKGSFHFSACKIEHERSPDRLLGAEQILMEGLRMVDEWRTFAARVPNPNQAVRRSGSLDDYRRRWGSESSENQSRAEQVFQLVDGRSSVRRVIDLARIGTFEGTRALAALIDARAVELVESVLPPVAIAEDGGPSRVLSGLRFALAAVVPLALLAGVVWLGSQRLLAPAPVPGTAIELHALDRASASFETRRLRHALEAHRHLWGEWPGTLASVDRTGWAGSEEMAAPQVATYYYAQRGDGVLVLPPEFGSTR